METSTKEERKKIKRESGTRKAGGERARVISEITYEVSVDESHQSVKVSEWHFFLTAIPRYFCLVWTMRM